MAQDQEFNSFFPDTKHSLTILVRMIPSRTFASLNSSFMLYGFLSFKNHNIIFIVFPIDYHLNIFFGGCGVLGIELRGTEPHPQPYFACYLETGSDLSYLALCFC